MENFESLSHVRWECTYHVIFIPKYRAPKYSVSYIIGFLKGKSAVRVHRELLKERRMTGLHFWAAGYWVSTVGRDEAAVQRYIREQEHFDQGQGQLFD
jgi:REP-associated tyrosine transposase